LSKKSTIVDHHQNEKKKNNFNHLHKISTPKYKVIVTSVTDGYNNCDQTISSLFIQSIAQYIQFLDKEICTFPVSTSS